MVDSSCESRQGSQIQLQKEMRLWDASFSFRFPSDVTPGSPAAAAAAAAAGEYIIHVPTTFDNKMTYYVSRTDDTVTLSP